MLKRHSHLLKTLTFFLLLVGLPCLLLLGLSPPSLSPFFSSSSLPSAPLFSSSPPLSDSPPSGTPSPLIPTHPSSSTTSRLTLSSSFSETPESSSSSSPAPSLFRPPTYHSSLLPLISRSPPSPSPLFTAFISNYSAPYDPEVAKRGEWGKCKDIKQELREPKKRVLFAHGGVKNIFPGRWNPTHELVAVAKLRQPNLNGDFSSGISRLMSFQGHPSVMKLIAVCPEWRDFSQGFIKTRQAYILKGFGDQFNTIITPLFKYRDLEFLEAAIKAEGLQEDWLRRYLVAIDYARIIAFTHNSGEEINPWNHPLVQKDRKISQILISPDIRLKLNDVEAMPIAKDVLEMRKDIVFMVKVFKHIMGDFSFPQEPKEALDDVIRGIEQQPEDQFLDTAWVLERLLAGFK